MSDIQGSTLNGMEARGGFDAARIEQELARPLARELVSERPGPKGIRVKYLAITDALEQANRIFGWSSWHHETVEEPLLRTVEWVDDKGKAQSGQMYTAVVRVAVEGVGSHTATGTGEVRGSGLEAHARAIKSAEVNALKRGLRCYGAAFGLGLGGPQERKRRTGQGPPVEKAVPPVKQAAAPQAGKDAGQVSSGAQMRKLEALGRADYGAGWEAKRKEIVDYVTDGAKRPLRSDEAARIITGLEGRAAERKAPAEEDGKRAEPAVEAPDRRKIGFVHEGKYPVTLTRAQAIEMAGGGTNAS